MKTALTFLFPVQFGSTTLESGGLISGTGRILSLLRSDETDSGPQPQLCFYFHGLLLCTTNENFRLQANTPVLRCNNNTTTAAKNHIFQQSNVDGTYQHAIQNTQDLVLHMALPTLCSHRTRKCLRSTLIILTNGKAEPFRWT